MLEKSKCLYVNLIKKYEQRSSSGKEYALWKSSQAYPSESKIREHFEDPFLPQCREFLS